MDIRKLFFDPNGRIGRQEFWIGWLVLFGVGAVSGWIPVIGLLISLVSIWCSICVYSKRLHDMGKTGWLQLIPILATVVGMVAFFIAVGAAVFAGASADTMATDEAAMMAAIMSAGAGAILSLAVPFLVYIGFTIWVGVSSGEVGPNRFGPSPRAGENPAEAGAGV